ncbi:unnamed protein product [Owenia fusiformis]|uniref:Uncharacterized protein n=1 Tax=Owenia fusiformis TaxID=6347 RepID=A0A8S4N1B5_OWEFU|nr:unnamed protein product [Owenia fusiformis]
MENENMEMHQNPNTMEDKMICSQYFRKTRIPYPTNMKPFMYICFTIVVMTLKTHGAIISHNGNTPLGGNIMLNCTRTDPSKKWFWDRKISGSEKYQTLFLDGRIQPGVNPERFELIQNGRVYNLVLRNAQLKDDGQYRCFQVFKEAETTEQTILTVVVMPEPLNVTGLEIAHNEGETAVVHCTSKHGRPKPDLIWRKNGSMTEIGFVTTDVQHEDLTFSVTRSLIVPISRSSLTDEYICEARVRQIDFRETTAVFMNAHVRPFEPYITGAEFADVGSRYILKCHSNGGVPPANITWYSKDITSTGTFYTQQQSFQESQKISDNSYNSTATLVLKPRIEDNGRVYVCNASNSVLVKFREKALTTSIALDLSYKPVVNATEIVRVTEGNEARIYCNVQAKPEANITWYRNFKAINPEEDRVTTEANAEGDQLLIVKPVLKSDNTAVYECVAINRLGMSSKHIKLSVQYIPYINIGPEALTVVREGDNVTLGCDVDANPPGDAIQWYKNGNPLDTNNTALYQVTNNTLMLLKGTKPDNGHYRCRSRNSIGLGESSALTLQVQYPPENLTVIPAGYMSSMEGSTVPDIFCTSQAIPQPTYEWRYNGEYHNAGAKLIPGTKVTGGHRGTYHCIAKNKWGQDSTSFFFNVSYSPLCVQGQRLKYAAVIGQPTRVYCYVHAYPSDVTFRWLHGVAQTRDDGVLNGTDDVTVYSRHDITPRSKTDFGVYECSGGNSIGVMKQSCSIELIEPSPPESPTNCRVTASTWTSIEILCDEGFDGGAPQTFSLQRKRNGVFRTELNQTTTHFYWNKLQHSTTYTLRVCAVNALVWNKVICGRELLATTPPDPSKPIISGTSRIFTHMYLLALVICITTLLGHW